MLKVSSLDLRGLEVVGVKVQVRQVARVHEADFQRPGARLVRGELDARGNAGEGGAVDARVGGADLGAVEVHVDARVGVVVEAAVHEGDAVLRRRLGGERLQDRDVAADRRVGADDDLAARAGHHTAGIGARVHAVDDLDPTASAAVGPREDVACLQVALEVSVDDGLRDGHGRGGVFGGRRAGGDGLGGGDGRPGSLGGRDRLHDRHGRRAGQDAAAGAADARRGIATLGEEQGGRIRRRFLTLGVDGRGGAGAGIYALAAWTKACAWLEGKPRTWWWSTLSG